MKNILQSRYDERGFTLLEVIVIFILVAFLGSMLVEYMGTSLTRGSESVVMVQKGFSLNSVMEKITADYEDEYKAGNYDFATFKSNIENGNIITNTPFYGDYTVKANETDYIYFVGNSEVQDNGPGGYNILKITLAAGNQSLTVLFRK